MNKIILILLILLTEPATACNCNDIPYLDIAGSVTKSDLIVHAKILRIDQVRILRSQRISMLDPTEKQAGGVYDYINKHTVLVKTGYKGKHTDTMYIYSEIGDGDCGYTFDLEKEYAIYAYQTLYLTSERKRTTVYQTSICMRTMPFTANEEKLLQDQLE